MSEADLISEFDTLTLQQSGFSYGPIDEYFQSLPHYSYTPYTNISLLKTFRKAQLVLKWSKEQSRAQRSLFYEAINAEFSYRIGTDDLSLEAWQQLAEVLGLPLSGSKNKCKQVR